MSLNGNGFMFSRVTNILNVIFLVFGGYLLLFNIKQKEVAVLPQSNVKEVSSQTTIKKNKVVKSALSRKGKPYRSGANGPNRFDCSGLTQWSYARIGKKIPRIASQQYKHSHKINRKSAKPGDLVFFTKGKSVYHTAIYLGRNKIVHAPASGQRVKVEKIWTRSVKFGRYVTG